MLRKGASERVLYRMCTKTFTWRLLTGPELTEVYLKTKKMTNISQAQTGSKAVSRKIRLCL